MSLRKSFLLVGTMLSAGLAPALAAPVSAQSSPTPHTSYTRYDALGRVTGTISADPDGSGPLPRIAVRNSYTPKGELTMVEYGTLAAWQGNEVAPKDWTGFQVERIADTIYDDAGRKLRESVRAAGIVRTLTQHSYDAFGRLECSAVRMNRQEYVNLPDSACAATPPGADGPDRITRNVYNAASEVVQVRTGVAAAGPNDPGEAEVTNSYTDNGLRRQVIDGNGNRAEFVYDGHDRLTAWVFPSAARPAAFDDSSQASALATAGALNPLDYEGYGYDAAGNRTSLRTRAGQAIGYSYDALGRMRRKDRPGAEPDVAYSYDLRGLQLSATFTGGIGSGGGGSVVNAYDPVGRLVVSDQTDGGVTRRLLYDYDAGGNRTRLTHPGGFSVAYEHDELGRTTRMIENGGTAQALVLATYRYRPQGERSAILHGNGTETRYGYDPAGRLETLTHDLAGTAWDNEVSFAYNQAGQITSRTSTNALYGTDAAPGTATYGVNGLNQLETLNGAAGPSSDANGNMTNDGARSYSYSSENLLLTGGPATFEYDPLNRLVGVGGAGSQAGWRFLRDGQHLAAAHHPAAPAHRLVFGPGTDELAAWYVPSRWFAHTDERGSVVALTDDGGNLVRINRYDEYGRPNANNWGWIQYTGQQWMNDIPIYYYKARFYQPELGRFMQVDPVGYDDQTNLYGYVGNDPINLADADGQHCVAVAHGSAYCRRARMYGRWDDALNGRTRFFAAASATMNLFGSLDHPASGLVSISRDFRTFMGEISNMLESLNGSLFAEAQRSRLSGAALDRELVRREQTAVQGYLDLLKHFSPIKYNSFISEANRRMNARSAPFPQDRAYIQVLNGVRRSLGRNIDFGRQSDREAIGNALTAHVRSTGGCDIVGSRIKSC